MPLIAITGGIGAGKSAVAARFQTLGAEVLDADHLAHGLYQPASPAWQAMLHRWGQDILSPDSTIDRQKVAAIVFSSHEELLWLNNLLHPQLKEILRQRTAAASGLLFCAIPLLFESGWQDEAATVIAVWCDSDTQRERLLARGWSLAQIQARLEKQLSMDEKLLRSDYGIISSCSWQNLFLQCDYLYRLLQMRLS
ncbi:MAG: dephospho-CoA kinase [Lentisphaerae bacterium]|nr:dephospho-CoA kinase [Lentisphaerota bacterium]